MIFRTAVEHAKKHPGLIPQFFFICLGMGGASMYLLRLAKGPHVTWNKTKNPEPWNKLDPTYQYKFVAIGTDYKNLRGWTRVLNPSPWLPLRKPEWNN